MIRQRRPRPHLPFYRSNTIRFSFIITGTFIAWALSFGPDDWHHTPSLNWLHHALPWPVMSIGFALYVVALLTGRIGAIIFADFLGLAMYGAAFVALLATLEPTRSNNPLALSAMALVCVLHFAAGRLAVIERERRDDGRSR